MWSRLRDTFPLFKPCMSGYLCFLLWCSIFPHCDVTYRTISLALLFSIAVFFVSLVFSLYYVWLFLLKSMVPVLIVCYKLQACGHVCCFTTYPSNLMEGVSEFLCWLQRPAIWNRVRPQGEWPRHIKRVQFVTQLYSFTACFLLHGLLRVCYKRMYK